MTDANPTPSSAPRTDRPPQTIGGGYFILRRARKGRRLTLIGRYPYEHGSLEEAEAQAEILAARTGGEFAVFRQVGTVMPPATSEIEQAAALLLATDSIPEAPEPSSRPALIVERRSKRATSPHRAFRRGGHVK
ncbi:hypothetical protein J2X36_004410 [Methylobacterium sp. BE186]|uniref:hypothetical protein n=1 Tax=Methylobacterium sp. BE186 TaxID=2817715 RepID=UPI002865E747|nr:hypothetical protein [Methylobacterium sp. BE186]MDR7039634.1 hypothetical protein [Methylobacterium sp. BE186]